MSETITLTMTREQAYCVMNATELLARLHIGQFEEITHEFLDQFCIGETGYDSARREEVDNLLKQTCKKIFGTNVYGWPNIESKDIVHHRCWAVYTTLRHAIAWHDHPEGGTTVDFYKPLGYGEKMPKCEIKEDA